jgi:branched-chain amino acid transport system substrate-binding protein
MAQRSGEASSRMRGGWRATAAAALAALAAAALAPSCSLSNISADACSSHDDCRQAYGFGSACIDGYCGDPTVCETGHDCRRAFGGGACVDNLCVDEIPPDPFGACTVFEPEELGGTKLIAEGDEATPVVIGGVFLFEVDFAPPIQDAARLAVREINKAGGLIEGQPLAMVICDNGGPMNGLDGDERTERIHGVVDYLAGTLGVPLIIGPLTSGDTQQTIQHVIAQGYPTVMISPSATSPSLTEEPDRLDPEDPLGLFWRTPPPDDLQGQVLAQNVAGIYPELDATLSNVVAVYRDDAYGLGLANAFQVSFAGNTTLQKFDVGADLAAAAAQAASTNPDAVLFIDIGGDRAVSFITAMAGEPNLSGKPLYLADGSKNASIIDPALPTSVQDIVFADAVGTVTAPPEGPLFNLFQSSYQTEFGSDPAENAFTANAYDAVFVGAAGLVFAMDSGGGTNYDGRNVAEGMSRLVGGPELVEIGQLEWSNVKNGLTTGEKRIDIEGISGPLDFDITTGEAPAAIEIWKPSNSPVDCGTADSCFARLEIVSPP